MNPRSSDGDRRAPPESDLDFEKRKKSRYPRLYPHKPPRHLLHPTERIRPPPPPPQDPIPEFHLEYGTFTTRLHYNGVLEEGFGKNYVNGELLYIHRCDPEKKTP